MLSVSIGPLALPVAPLALLAAIGLAAWVGRRRAPTADAASAESAVWISATLGLLGARAGWLAEHASAYAAQPLAALDIRDGGFSPWTGLLVGALALGWRARARPGLRRALGAAALAGLAAWGLALVLLRLAPGHGAGREWLQVSLVSLRTGEQKTLAEVLNGRPAVVNLWASWCAPCRAEMPVLGAAQARHAEIVWVLANQGEPAATVQRFLHREGLPDDGIWLDAGSRLGQAAGSSSLPTTLFLGGDGRRVDAHAGVLNGPALAARLARLRAAGS